MERYEAVMRCMACGAIFEVPAAADAIAGEAYWHRRIAHGEQAEVEFATRFPFERSAGTIVIHSGSLGASQADTLAAWDARIESMSFRPDDVVRLQPA